MVEDRKSRMTIKFPSMRRFPSMVPIAVGALVWICASVLVVYAWRETQKRAERDAMAGLQAEAGLVVSLLQQRLQAFELVTTGAASLASGPAMPTREEWNDYVAGLDLPGRFPSMIGLGYARDIESAGLPNVQLEIRAQTGRLFSLQPRGVRAEYGPVVYLAPESIQTPMLIGYDMYSDPIRREAMAGAMDSGHPQLSGLVSMYLDQRAADAPSMQFYAPVYLGGIRPTTPAARRANKNGWVFIPFRVQEFVASSLRSMNREMRLRVDDVTDPLRARSLFRDSGVPAGAAAPTIRQDFDAYGRKFRLDFYRLGDFGTTGSAWVLWAGLPLALAIGLIAFLIVRTQSRAQALAERMSESYRRSEQRFRNSMRYSAIGKALLDSHGRIVEANPSLAHMLGKPQESLAGQLLGEQFIETGDALRTEQLQTLREGAYRTTRSLRRGDGQLRQAQLTFAPVPGDEGQDVVGLVQVEDITERVRAEAQVRALNRTLEERVAARTRELTQANGELESFAYSVSHDLRAPLRSIEGFSRLLQERYEDRLDEAGRSYLERVRNASTRMDGLIDAILKISRIGRSELHPRTTDLSQLAKEVVSELREQEPGREVDVRIDPGLAAWADPPLAQNLLQNLLGNAWKFTSSTAAPRIRMYRDGHAFVVEDNGAGFDPSYANKLFRPFQRLHGQEEFPGHGIGLASVRRILERHGGSIRAEGEPGKGARFIFVFPDRPADESNG
jgi:PAS domain S-box-containing protein